MVLIYSKFNIGVLASPEQNESLKSPIWTLLISFSTGMAKTLHEFKVLDIKKQEFDFRSLEGKVVLVVNVASHCGFTPQVILEQSSVNF